MISLDLPDILTKTDELEQTPANWKVLIVDDDKDIHAMTKLVLKQYEYDNRPLELSSAYNDDEAKEFLKNNPDTALVLLDVVMDKKDSGLQLVKFIRKDLDNHQVRIVLRTGQPGEAPEETVIKKFDINDYKEKTELTARKLRTTITTSLRNFSDILTILSRNSTLAKFADELTNAYNRLRLLDEEKMNALRYLSHEINTPLNAIGASQIFNTSTMSEENRQVLYMVERGFDRLNALVKAFIRYSEFASKPIELKPKSILLRPTLENIINQLSIKSLTKNLTFDVQISNDATIFADNRYYRLIIEIIIDNAIEYSFENGRIKLEATMDKKRTTLIVSDYGEGIKKRNLETIFTAFALEEHYRKKSGFGLNLPMVKNIVDTHNGRIWAQSEGTNKGSRFFVEFPSKE